MDQAWENLLAAYARETGLSGEELIALRHTETGLLAQRQYAAGAPERAVRRLLDRARLEGDT